MKKTLQFALLLLALLLPATATAYDFEVDGIYYIINGNEAIVTNGSYYGDGEYGYYSGDVTLPETVTYEGTTYPVTAIDHIAFANCHDLTSVSIPNSVIAIGNNAFYGCTSLTNINIPHSVTFIEGNFLAGCDSLTSIIVDSGNPKYDSRDNCNAVIETASNTLIAGCMGTVIPNSVITIDNYAFAYCSGLTSVNIPNSVTTIGVMAFARCGNLTNVNIGNSVSEIGDWAFVSCGSLTSIIVDSGNPKYDSRNNCNAIIETASNTLIVGCMGTVIPGSVHSIGYSAFYGCSGLTSVDIPNSVTTIGKDAFYGCTSLTSINIPNSVTTIGDYAFQSCTGLTSVDLPNSITAISDGVFGWCTNLTSVNIPNSVTTIGGGAFYLSGLTSVDIPNSVTTIGSGAFYDCQNLTSVDIPNSVTTIGDEAFSYCSNLTNVTIPNSLTHIGDEAFTYCWALTEVYSFITYPSEVESGENSFCISLQEGEFDYSGRTLHVPHGTADAYQADEHWYPYFGQIMEDLTPEHLPGDVTGDGEVNIADVNAVIAVILGGNSNPAADVNSDGEVNIADINAVINIILNPETTEEHEYVDLGLPSGTLWATMNVGANTPEEYGDYFAWGETTPKEAYSWETYKWCNGTSRTMTKYCTKSSYGTVDNKTELDPEDDAAYVNWGSSWRMPTIDQIKELIDNCSGQWVMVNGVNGLLLTGSNGNTMFLPAGDCRHHDYPNAVGSFVNNWSRTLDSDSNFFAYLLSSISEEEWGWYCGSRDYGFNVRAVRVR